jgi:hypothetical protein
VSTCVAGIWRLAIQGIRDQDINLSPLSAALVAAAITNSSVSASAGAMLCSDEEANEDEHDDDVVGKEEREGGVVGGQAVDADATQWSSSGSHSMPAWDSVVEVAGGSTVGDDWIWRKRRGEAVACGLGIFSCSPLVCRDWDEAG